MLKPHVFIHLARSRFTSTDADDGFRRGWVSEKQVETAIHGSVVKEMKVLALTGELNYAALQQRVQFIMDKTVQSLNRDYSVNAQSEHYVPSHHIDAQNMRLADSAIQDVKPSERQSDPFGEFTEESIQDEDERSRKERLFEEQMDLETKTLEEAVAKYRMLSYDLKKAGRGTAMKPSEHLMMSWFEPMTEHLMQLAEADTMSATARLMFGTLDAEALACLAMHELVGMLIKEPGGVPYVKIVRNVGTAVESESNMRMLREDKQAWKKLISNKTQIREWQINRAARNRPNTERWTEAQLLQVGSELLEAAFAVCKVEVGGAGVPAWMKEYRLHSKAKKGYQKQLVVYGHEMVFQTLDHNQAVAEGLFTTHKPMVCEPRPWSQRDVGGYLSMRTEVVRTRSWKHKQLLDQSDMSLVYDALNYLGSVPWKVNEPVLTVVDQLWAAGGGAAGMISRVDVPVPKAPTTDPSEDVDAWREHSNLASKALKANREMHSLRCDVIYKMRVARQFMRRRIYFPSNVDFRGRAYPLPPHLNHLGSDLSRGLLLFHEGKPLGPNGLEWLKVHLANVSGKDKLRFEDRRAWTDANMDKVLLTALDPLGASSPQARWWMDAEDPLQALATIFELAGAVKSSDPASFISHLPVHMDGSCNGLQHYGALGRDLEGGAAVNLSPHEAPQDVYTGVLNIVMLKVEEDAKNEHPSATLIMGKITRKVIKQTVMTSVYGVTMIGARNQILNRLRELDSIDWPDDRAVTDASTYLAKLALSSLGDLFSSAQHIMEWLAELARLVAKEGHEVTWVTPLGFPVLQPYKKTKGFQVQTLKHKLTLSSSEKLPVNTSRQTSAFPPNFVHSLDATHMFMTALDCRDKGLAFASVHDSYWTHAGTMESMNSSLREQFIQLYSLPILEDLHNGLVCRFPHVRFPPVPARGALDLNSVRDSKYFFA